jgi:hypothetical protein
MVRAMKVPGCLLLAAMLLCACDSNETDSGGAPGGVELGGTWMAAVVVGDGGPGFVGSRFSGGGGQVLGLSLDAGGLAALSFATVGTVGMANSGAALAAASTSTDLNAWAAPVALGAADEFRSWPRAVASDGDGGVLVVWSADTRLYSARFARAAGWQPRQAIATTALDGVVDAGVVSERAQALVVWSEDTAMLASSQGAGAPWGAETTLGERSQIALAGTPGRALLLAFGGSQPLRFATATGEGTLSPLALVPSGDAASFGRFGVCADGGGGFHAVWTRGMASSEKVITTARYRPEAGWEQPSVLARIAEVAVGPGIACGVRGHALAYWTAGDRGLHGVRFTPGSGWERDPAAPIGLVPPSVDGRNPAVARAVVDGEGASLLVWTATERLDWSRAAATGPWRAPASIPGSVRVDGAPFQLAGNPSGAAVAAWVRPEACGDCGPAPRDILAARFVPR